MATPGPEKKLKTYRLSPKAQQTIEALAAHLGLTRTGVIETAVRELRDRHRSDESANELAMRSVRAMKTAARKAGFE